MQTKIVVLLLLTLFATAAHAQEDELEILNQKERIDFVRTHHTLPPRVTITDTTGRSLKGINLLLPLVDGELLSGIDYYKNASGKIVKVVVRKAKAADYDLNRKLFDEEEQQLRGSLDRIKVNCADLKGLLSTVLATENENRKNGQVFDAETDNKLEATVIAVLQQCGTPTFQAIGFEGVRAILMVLLHARRVNQEKYRPVLDEFLAKGYIKKGSIVSLVDNLLMSSGRKQLYGTQIVFYAKSGYFLYPCEDPTHLDERRAAMGLPPIDEFLKEREEFYRADIEK